MARKSLIAPLAAAGRAEEIVGRLTEAINLGLLADGEQLPAETDFAAQLGVSPMTLRDAIATLRNRGLIETRRGRNGGSFVRRTLEPPQEPDLLRLRNTSISELRDIAEEHAALCGAAARMAAERRTPDGMRKLGVLVEQMAASGTRGPRLKADCRFHVDIAVMSHSERLTRHEVRLQGELAGLLWLDLLPEEEVAVMVREHQRIVDAIAAEEGDVARRLAEDHVRANLKRIVRSHLAVQAVGQQS